MLILLILTVIPNAYAATIYADSCSHADVQLAIESANDGDTVNVPAGTCTWTDGIDIPDNKKLYINGVGRDLLEIQYTGNAFDLGESGSQLVGFTFNGASIRSNGNYFVVGNCRFTNEERKNIILVTAKSPAVLSDIEYPTGLIYENLIHNGRIITQGSLAIYTDDQLERQNYLYSEEHHPVSSLIGSQKGVYIEDNVFTTSPGITGNIIDTSRAGGYIFRFNDVMGEGNMNLEVHGTQDAGRAGRYWEIYNNKLDEGNHPGRWTGMFIRGGTGFIFNNEEVGPFNQNFILFDVQRAVYDKPQVGYCDGTKIWDGNEILTNQTGQGYPCVDQIGIGGDLTYWGKWMSETPGQLKIPVYLWNNADDDVGCNHPNHAKKNRDWYNGLGKGVQISTTHPFNGSEGVGLGVLGLRPPTCTEGVAYWALDQGEWNSNNPGPDGQLYRCTSTNNWNLYYTPYQYPHPLRENSQAVCGDSILETDEECDDGNTIDGDGCSSSCQTESTVPTCGNDFTEPGEACDGDDINSYDCTTVAAGFSGGALSCNSNCKTYDVSKCIPGNTINAASCSESDVLAAIDSASDGDTVSIPEGECTWTTGLYLNPIPSIIIKGSGIDKTTIMDNTPDVWGEYPFFLYGQQNKPFRITGITFTDPLSTSGYQSPIYIRGSSDFRIDHCKFTGNTKGCIGSEGVVRGVIDNCQFIDIKGQAVPFRGREEDWSSDITFGEDIGIFIEDCIFDNTVASLATADFDIGGKLILRNNILKNFWTLTHGYHDTGTNRGGLSFEIYNNEFYCNSACHGAQHIRSGTGVIFGNTYLEEEYGDFNWGPHRGIHFSFYGACTASECPGGYTGTNSAKCNSYPCPDQPGRGPNQEYMPIYIWDNTYPADFINVGTTSCTDCSNCDTTPSATGTCTGGEECMQCFIREGRDFFVDVPKPGYVPYVYPHPVTQIDTICTPFLLSELIAYIDLWKLGGKNLNEVMQAIVEWKNG